MNTWGCYSPNDVMPYWVSSEMPRREARAQFNRTMATRAERIATLAALLRGFGLGLSDSDDAVQKLNEWFVDVMTPLPDRSLPDRRSASVCEDVALFLGDVMISRHPELRWEFFIWGKKNIAYRCHVIMGFPHENPKLHANLDLPGIIHGYGVQVLEHRFGGPRFLELPEDHPLNGLPLDFMESEPERDRFLTLLGMVARRCQAP